MKKKHILSISVLLLSLLATQNTNAQFDLKSLKKKAMNKAIDNAFTKITNLCIGNKDESKLMELKPSDKAYLDYQNLKSEIDKLSKDLENIELLELSEDVKKIKSSIKKIKKTNPNANLASECNRINELKKKFKK
ncbi:hypothetical protein H9W90_10185 [Polaribacter pectinis]|uniref:Uncharacterized protein n=1 Tax=Polaribacter pectinis TaxID=2738844 RepID=A0A7G9L7G5_9FLAO|nr:hypothetical protein [Polaribacter pectinis]QNM84564.1 hypothetical protein H9W90_10185 [Polaribacter pectinis]